MANSKIPVKRFPPEMMQALIVGAKEQVSIQLPTRADATILRQKFYILRAAMRREGHHNYPLVERAEIRILPLTPGRKAKTDPHTLIIQPANADYLNALRQAGIEAEEDTPFPSSLPTPPSPAPIPTDYLKILQEAANKDSKGEQE